MGVESGLLINSCHEKRERLYAEWDKRLILILLSGG